MGAWLTAWVLGRLRSAGTGAADPDPADDPVRFPDHPGRVEDVGLEGQQLWQWQGSFSLGRYSVPAPTLKAFRMAAQVVWSPWELMGGDRAEQPFSGR